ncbi:hypothetical protein KKA02_00535, partial [Patescibacteria group bacterium]|nr:hypothetical protein [Patescibacteria group bacterium]
LFTGINNGIEEKGSKINLLVDAKQDTFDKLSATVHREPQNVFLVDNTIPRMILLRLLMTRPL